jgi:hypothetical protein
MPRQPYLSLVSPAKGIRIDIGPNAIGQRPTLEILVGSCLLAWPLAEAEMALVLGHLLGAQNDVMTLAVFQILRRSSNQRAAITEAANFLPNPVDKELLKAMLALHKSIESERNDLTHGCLGTSNELPEAPIWLNANDYIKFRSRLVLGDPIIKWDDSAQRDLLNSLGVYRADDLQSIYDDVKMLSQLWYTVIYLQSHLRSPATTSELYARLSSQPRIAAVLTTLRHKNARESTLPKS